MKAAVLYEVNKPLVSRTYPLEGINEAFAAMKAGEVARSIGTF